MPHNRYYSCCMCAGEPKVSLVTVKKASNWGKVRKQAKQAGHCRKLMDWVTNDMKSQVEATKRGVGQQQGVRIRPLFSAEDEAEIDREFEERMQQLEHQITAKMNNRSPIAR